MKEITKHSGKRSIGLPGTGSFLHVGKWSQGHVLDQMAQNGPPGNTPKKGSLSRKRPKEDERVDVVYLCPQTSLLYHIVQPTRIELFSPRIM